MHMSHCCSHDSSKDYPEQHRFRLLVFKTATRQTTADVCVYQVTVPALLACRTATQVKCQVNVLGDVWLLRDAVGGNHTQFGAWALDNLPGFVGGFSLAALLGQRRISRSVELTAAPAPTGTWEMDAFGDQVPCVGVTGSAPTPRALGRA